MKMIEHFCDHNNGIHTVTFDNGQVVSLPYSKKRTEEQERIDSVISFGYSDGVFVREDQTDMYNRLQKFAIA